MDVDAVPLGMNFVSVAFSLDGRTLTSGSWDNSIKLWDVSNVTEVGK
jgi:WD40 repeat protein